MKKWGILFFVVLLFGVLLFWYIQQKVVEQGPLKETVVVEIAKGSSSQQVVRILSDNGVINHPYLFRALLKYRRVEDKIKAGEYQFEPQISMDMVLDKLIKGDVLFHKITIPEGYTNKQIQVLLDNEENLSGKIVAMPLEGNLLPETYTFSRGEKRSVIVQKAQSAMQNKLQNIWNNRAENLPYQNMQELLIMASIVEKETGVDDERAKVASVFVNRLKKGMLLQTDPTVIYALTRGTQDLGRPLMRKDLAYDDPYNTYVYAGLPPAPICNPGESSLYAAAHPEKTDYLYFVASGNGGHNFSKTLSEHNRNVANWKNKR